MLLRAATASVIHPAPGKLRSEEGGSGGGAGLRCLRWVFCPYSYSSPLPNPSAMASRCKKPGFKQPPRWCCLPPPSACVSPGKGVLLGDPRPSLRAIAGVPAGRAIRGQRWGLGGFTGWAGSPGQRWSPWEARTGFVASSVTNTPLVLKRKEMDS